MNKATVERLLLGAVAAEGRGALTRTGGLVPVGLALGVAGIWLAVA